MKTTMAEQYPDIAGSGILKGNISWTELADFFHKAAMLRYFTPDNLHTLNPRLGTEGSKDKIGKLAEMGYFNRAAFLSITPKTKEFLEAAGRNVKIIQEDTRAIEARHGLLISETILRNFMRYNDFFYCLYPNFKALIPDACVLQKKENRMTVTFLEVEDSTKPKGYLDEKRQKYRVLAGWPELHSVWWRDAANKLGLDFCNSSEFCFQVVYFAEETAWEPEDLL